MPKAGILLIEDEPTSREILQYVLSEAGYPVDVSATAAAAHKQLDLMSYRLVIADWQLPDGDGIYIADRAFALGAWTLIITGHFSDLPPGTAKRHRLLMKHVRPAAILAIVAVLALGIAGSQVGHTQTPRSTAMPPQSTQSETAVPEIQVKQAQQQLKGAGLYKGAVDGT